ncbi:rhodanese-like domain-containing protein [Arabiibacter massiliensis]|uniref:rhodanese-like domain-containing protein n=1 Tax=Arabiibacter massiliensis TaxID=1870985 RepID=UPI000B423C8F|nr:rhodanese-like domain-containing protein [Arabiibacter massiliensis]
MMNDGGRAVARSPRRAASAAAATFALAGVLGLASCAAPASTNDAYAKITADEGAALMESGDPVIVDVRTPQEYADGHIPGAINIPVETIGADKPAELSDADAELIVYCRTGVRSKQASDKLIAMGYQHVNDMGGIVDWTGEKVTGTEPGDK